MPSCSSAGGGIGGFKGFPYGNPFVTAMMPGAGTGAAAQEVRRCIPEGIVALPMDDQ